MFIIFLIIFIALYIFLPFFASICLFVMSFLLRGKKTYWLLLLSVMTFSVLILLYNPSQDDDAFRYFQIMNLLKPIYTLKDVVLLSQSNQVFQYQASSIGFTFFEIVFSKSPYYNLLPYFNTIICLFSIFYPFLDLKERNLISGFKALYLSLPLFFVFNFLYTASTMRWALSCSLFNLIIYLYFEKIKKKQYAILIGVPILFHTGIILGTCVGVFMALVKNISLKKQAIVALLLFIYLKISTGVDISGSGDLASQVVGMTSTYSNDFMQHSLNGLIFIFIERFILILTIFTASLLLFSLRGKWANSRFEQCFILFIAIQAVLSFAPMIFDRYILITLFMALVVTAKNNLKVNLSINRVILFSNFWVSLLGIIVCYANVKRMPFFIPITQLIVSNIFYFFTHITSY